MARLALEVADIFEENRGHISIGQLKVMSAIERCRTAALGGHVSRCESCQHTEIAYNSCRNRHCSKCQGAAAKQWLAAGEAELLPVSYFHVVFTVPTQIGDIAYQNKAIVYDLLFKASAETLLTIGADPKHLGARLGLIGVLHTWGSALTHHPHAHFIVPGGGLSLDGHSWVASRPDFLVHVKVLSTLFRRLFLDKLLQLYAEQRLSFFGKLKSLEHPRAFKRLLARLRHRKWYVDARAPFSGPRAVLQSLSRYTHRVAIANSRLIACDEHHVTFKWKDYRAKHENRYKTMSLDTHEFIRRFLIHVLPTGFHRIRHYGFLGPMDNAHTTSTTVRRRLGGNTHDLNDNENTDDAPPPDWLLCPACGLTMRIVDVFDSAHVPLHRGRGPP